MVKRLRLTTAIRSDQTLQSYVGELAAMNFQPTTDDFCRDMGTSLHEVAMGAANAIDRIACVSGSDPDNLERAAFKRSDNRSLVFRNQTLTQQARMPMRVRFCPECLTDDIMHATDGGARRPHHHVYGRPQWYAAQYRTCVRHGVALAMVGTGPHARQHDFAGAVLPLVEDLGRIAGSLVRRPASDLERHLERRLLHGDEALLDGLGFSATARFCEVLGAVALFGPWPPHLGFNDDQWHQAGAAGYAIAKDGKEGIRRFFTGLKKPSESHPRDRANNDWGILYKWLDDTRDIELEPLLEVARDQIETLYPTAAGRLVLNKVVKERRMHSIWSASLEYDIHPDVLRTQLAAAGVVEGENDNFDNHVLFPSAPNLELLGKLSRGISALHARERIDCGRQVFAPLLEAGIIAPIVEVPSGYPLFDTAELDAFSERLLASAVSYAVQPAGLKTIAEARMRVGCGQAEIVKLILSGTLKNVGRLETKAGYASVLVDPMEIATHVRGRELGGIVVTHIVADLGIPHAGMVKMLNVHLPTEWRMHPTRRCLQQVVDDAVYSDFKSRYVSLRDLSRTAGVNHKRHAVALRNRGILPEPGFPDRVYLYRRQNLA